MNRTVRRLGWHRERATLGATPTATTAGRCRPVGNALRAVIRSSDAVLSRRSADSLLGAQHSLSPILPLRAPGTPPTSSPPRSPTSIETPSPSAGPCSYNGDTFPHFRCLPLLAFDFGVGVEPSGTVRRSVPEPHSRVDAHNRCLSSTTSPCRPPKRPITKRDSVIRTGAPDGSGAKRVAVSRWTSGDAGSPGGGLASHHSVTNLPTKVLVPAVPRTPRCTFSSLQLPQ